MAKGRHEAPPGGDAGGIFDRDNKPAAEGYPAVPAAVEPEKPPEPKPEGPKTTRGMNPVLKAADVIWKELKELTPAEREWVRGFIDSQFPKPGA